MEFKQRYLLGPRSSCCDRRAKRKGKLQEGRRGREKGSGRFRYRYRYPDAFTVDLENSCVRFGFECHIDGSRGAGTQLLYFNLDGKVNRRRRRRKRKKRRRRRKRRREEEEEV